MSGRMVGNNGLPKTFSSSKVINAAEGGVLSFSTKEKFIDFSSFCRKQYH